MTGADRNQKTAGARGTGRRKSPNVNSRPQAALGWAALALVAWAILRNGAVSPLNWHVMVFITLVLFSVQVAFDFRNGVPRPARSAVWLLVPFFAVVVWLLIQRAAGMPANLAHPVWAMAPEGAQPAISARPDAAGPVILRFNCYAMLFWILLRSSADARDGAIVYIQAIALFATALAIYGMVSQAIGYNILLDYTETASALRASLFNRNSYATVAVFGILANIVAYVNAVSGSSHRSGIFGLRDFLETFFSRAWVFAFGALVGLAALAMTLSRGGALAGVVGVVLLVWALRRGSETISLRTLAIPVGLVAFVALFMSSGVIERLDAGATGARPEVFKHVWAGALDRPLLGHGVGAFPVAFRPYTPASQAAWVWDRAHNSYLENAFEFGLPAAALLFATLGFVGWRLFNGVRTRRRNQGTPAFALACFAAAAFHSLVDFSLQIPGIAALFAAILGIGWGQSFPRRRRSSG